MDRGYVWQPSREIVAASNAAAFMRHCAIEDYDALIAFGDSDPETFWRRAIEFLGIRFDRPFQRVLDRTDGPEWARWCLGGTINVVDNCLDKHRGTPREAALALIDETEAGAVRRWTFGELDAESCRIAGALRQLGIGPGDPVGLYMPMQAEVAAAYFGILRIGAIAVPLFSGFAAEAIATRLNDADAKAVIAADVSHRRGAVVAMKAMLDEALEAVPSVASVIVRRNGDAPPPMRAGRDHDWADIVAPQPARAETRFVDSEHPALLVYTSGTSGKPKGVVLPHAGITLKMGLDFSICMDLKPDDRLIWMSDFGWVVGAMTVTAAAFRGATIVLVEGTPDYPESGRMWRLVQDHRISILGTAPTAIRGLMRHGLGSLEPYDLSSIRLVASTGEPWTDEAWMWMFEHVCQRRAPLLNWSGGTEIGGGILCGTVVHPLKPCSFGAAVPGMGADILDPDGNPVAPGEVGELVLRQPSPGLTRGVWRDDERYLDAYWRTYPGIWRHGDWASRDADGLWYVHGRSDDTMNIAGKRTGPAEIEGLVMATGRVSEAAAIGVPDPISGTAVMCVCVPAPGETGDRALADDLRVAVERRLGKPFRPKHLIFVDDLPKTRSLKIMRRVVRALILNEDPGDLSALTNPEAVDALRRMDVDI